MKNYTEVAISSVREAVLFNAIGGAVALAALLLVQIPLSDSFGFIVLIESCGLMLVGGAMGVAGQATTRKVAEWITRRKLSEQELSHSDLVAALYALTGGILFAEVSVMSLLLA